MSNKINFFNGQSDSINDNKRLKINSSTKDPVSFDTIPKDVFDKVILQYIFPPHQLSMTSRYYQNHYSVLAAAKLIRSVTENDLRSIDKHLKHNNLDSTNPLSFFPQMKGIKINLGSQHLAYFLNKLINEHPNLESIKFKEAEIETSHPARLINWRQGLPPTLISHALTYLNCGNCQSFSLKNICQFPSLRKLKLSKSDENELPAELTKLQHLTALSIQQFVKLTNVDSVGQLTNLQKLRFVSVQLSYLPSSLERLSKLTDLTFCHALLNELRGIAHFPSLTNLDLSESLIADLPDELRELTNLRFVTLNNCRQLTNIDAISDLVNLLILEMRTTSVPSLPDMSKLSRLHTLDLSYGKTEDISKIGTASSLLSVDLINTPLTDLPESFKGLSHLKNLSVDGCKMLTSFGPLQFLHNLRHLDISDTNLTSISPPFAGMTNLQVLHANECNLENIDSVALLTNLTKLEMKGTFRALPSHFTSLQKLVDLSIKAKNLSDISPIYELTQLRELSLEHTKISRFNKNLAKLSNLTLLRLNDSKEFISIDKLTLLSNLEYIGLIGTAFASVPPTILDKLPKGIRIDI